MKIRTRRTKRKIRKHPDMRLQNGKLCIASYQTKSRSPMFAVVSENGVFRGIWSSPILESKNYSEITITRSVELHFVNKGTLGNKYTKPDSNKIGASSSFFFFLEEITKQELKTLKIQSTRLNRQQQKQILKPRLQTIDVI